MKFTLSEKDFYKLQHDIKEALFWMESAYTSSSKKEKWTHYFFKGKTQIETILNKMKGDLK